MAYFYSLQMRKNLPGPLKYLCLLLWFSCCIQFASAQYTLNGSATQDNCHCYTLTPDANTMSGSVWNNNKINLAQSFTFTFNVFLGCTDAGGADGIVFVLQPISTSIGSTGGGLGYEGITPSIGVTLDTWQNTNNNDPVYDHLAIQINGDLNHTSANNLAGAVTISASADNVEDCNWHILKISWDATSKKYEIYFDGVLRLSLTKDFVTDVFNGDPMVFWGFTGSTGGSKNLQKFCTTLSPVFSLLPDQKRCIGESITFHDSSLSFAPIIKRYFDFGDGSPIDSVNINPVHTYTTAGDYQVSLTIIGADGCIEVNRQTVRIGTKPIANFKANNSCEGSPVLLLDSSYAVVGTINNWYWNLANGTSIQQNPSATYTSPGSKTISLAVRSLEGCISDTAYKSIYINPKPVVDISFSNACVNSIVNFTATDNGVNITAWRWDFGDGIKGSGKITPHVYINSGNYSVTFFAIGQNGCISDTIKKLINIYGTNASAGNDTIAVASQPVQLHAIGGLSYQWIPSTGLDNPNIADPIAVLTKDQTYILKAFTPEGCDTYDTLNIKIYKGPDIYVPTAFTPNNDGINDILRAIPVGITRFDFLKIYNRWGQEVFNTSNSKIGWDGLYKGSQIPGVYIWITSGVDFKGNLITKKGTATLLK
ncbi:MAG: hypothetical protein JWN83_1966 [Chitinophagaceae bacterium]|nr:hypothetical protein [Chitinophagaceae bacterium]